MNEAPGVLIYKCRRCGCLVKSFHAPDAHMGLFYAMNDIRTPQWGAFVVSPTDIHGCADGGYGVTDLIGSEPDGVKPKETP